MEGTWLWVILAVVVIAAIVAALAMAARQRTAKQSERADSMRHEAGEQSTRVRQQESKAAEADANARAAKAAADAKSAEADRLAMNAEHHQTEAAGQRSDVDDRFRQADEIDPHSGQPKSDSDTATDGPAQTSPQSDPTTDERYRDNPR